MESPGEDAGERPPEPSLDMIPSPPDIALRLGCALVASAVLGLERESHGRAAGLRTTLLVGVGAAISMILSESFYYETTAQGPGWRPDPARLAAGVLTGMGFLGAGTIIRQENIIRGVTTAAVLWFVTMLGLAFGSGQFLLGLAGFGVALLALFLLPAFETRLKTDWYAHATVVLRIDGPGEKELQEDLLRFGIVIKDVELEYDLQADEKRFRFALKFKRNRLFDLAETAVRELRQRPGVLRIHWS